MSLEELGEIRCRQVGGWGVERQAEKRKVMKF